MNRRRHTEFHDLDGIVLLDKPQGLSSNQALQRVRRLLGAAKGGHTGSLDPLATGLLPLCFGEATKIAGVLLGQRKAYRVRARLGVRTDTGDADGQAIETRPLPELDAARIEAALAPLRGRIRQRPPAYSALKQRGEPLYAKARRGEALSVPEREVEVHSLDLIGQGPDWLELEVVCGSGTYVRSLVESLGEDLGCGAHVAWLRRSWVEPFTAPDMITLEELERLDPSAREARVLPLEAGLAGLVRVELDADAERRFMQGQRVRIPDAAPVEPGPGPVAVFGVAGRALGLGERAGHGLLRPRRLFKMAPGCPSAPR